MRKHLLIWLFVGVLAIVGIAISRSHADGGGILTPIVEVAYRAGTSEEIPSEDTIGATIIATLPNDIECDCGARFEAKKQNSEEWITLGLFAQVEEGDEQQQYQWTITTNIFELDIAYDIRVRIFDRFGAESPYGTTQVTMSPYKEPPCADGSFANLKKDTFGTGEDAVIFFSWNKVCAESQEANRYVLYKNSTRVRETDEGANNIAVAGTPDGATWKIEAFGEEPPNSDPGVIKTCGEVITKINAKTHGATYSTQARITDLNQCQVVGTWLRAIITWEPYINQGGYNNQELSPPAWMNITLNDPQYFNYPLPRNWNPRPGFPGQVFPDAFDKCGYNNQNTSTGSYTDPWGSPHGPVSWTCNIEYNSSNNATTYRYWVNFDLNATGGGEPVWPITTTFSY